MIDPLRVLVPVSTLLIACGPSPPGDVTTGSSGTTVASTGPATTGEITTGADPTGMSAPGTSSSSEPTSAGSSGSTGGTPGCAYERAPVMGLSGFSQVAADFDQDGTLDLAAQLEGETLQLFFGDGSGLAFTPGPVAAIGEHGRMALGDFDGDGRFDLVHYDLAFTPEIRVQLNIGGEFGPPIAAAVDAVFQTFRVADVDGDGDSDLSHGGTHSEPVRVWRSDAGVLTEAHQLMVQACYATASDWADYDGDGDVDLAVIGDCNAVIGMPPIAVHLREGEGYTMLADAGLAEATDPSVLEAGDYDGDGIVDVVTQGFGEDPAFERHPGLGGGKFGPRERFSVPADMWVRRAIDGDGDGLADLIVSGPDTASETVLFRSTGAGFEPCVVGAGAFVEAGDFDGDGRIDVLLEDFEGFVLARML